MKEHLHSILEGNPLSAGSAQSALEEILAGAVMPELTGAFLAGLNCRPPRGPAIAGFVRALQKRMIEVPLPADLLATTVDVCGTGGDGRGTFNVSTTAAFVVAAGGLRVAKHGNRAVSSLSGSFDLLEALGVPFTQTPMSALLALRSPGLAFLFAPAFHPALGAFAPLRRALGFRTIFNLLGPLLNPARVGRQLVGVYSAELVVPVAEALGELGSTEALVVHGDDGGDELSLCGPTTAARLKNGRIQILRFSPEQLKLPLAEPAALQGGSAGRNAQIARAILSGEPGPRREIVALNAGAAFVVGGLAEDLREGFALACRAIDGGDAGRLLERISMQAPQGAAR